ncbi:MAG TPA: aminoacyl-tRNA hydrolase [Candidatus Saccharimonadales bacterium]|nr:aminoacyl-tRNA hydrolase [Candidatus Saccharimonadales bacterium]
MKLIVGLGNPGEKYEKTRHNLGFMVVEHFLHDFEPVGKTQWDDNKKFKSDIAEITWESKSGSEKVILVKPKTYMNNSGMAVRLLTDFYKIAPEDVWIIQDEIDLPLGSMKIRLGGASAGHHGVESVMEHLGTDKFWRFRLGIGMQKGHGTIADHTIKNAEDFVLGTFGGHERSHIKELIKRAVKAIELGLTQDLHASQNRYNTK